MKNNEKITLADMQSIEGNLAKEFLHLCASVEGENEDERLAAWDWIRKRQKVMAAALQTLEVGLRMSIDVEGTKTEQRGDQTVVTEMRAVSGFYETPDLPFQIGDWITIRDYKEREFEGALLCTASSSVTGMVEALKTSTGKFLVQHQRVFRFATAEEIAVVRQ